MNILNRRRFLLRTVAITGGGILAACKGGSGEPQATTSASTFDLPTPAIVVKPAEVLPGEDATARRGLSTISEIRGRWSFQTATADTTDEPLASSSAEFYQPATVPGTVLTSLIDNGVYPDPLYRQIVTSLIKDSLKDTDYLYRTIIDIPVLEPGQRFWLRFDGINYLADIWLGSTSVGRIEGAFKRGYFDVTDIVKDWQGQIASLSVKVHKLDYSEDPLLPNYESGVTRGGRNGGPTGVTLRNGPTFFCTGGWDWLPTIPDRCLGIWQPVYSFTTGAFRIVDMRVDPTLAEDLSSADLAIDVTLSNHAGAETTGTLVGKVGDIEFRRQIALPADGQTKTVALTSADIPELLVTAPKLWWPNGYGDPFLYPVSIRVDVGETTSDVCELKVGLRKIEYSRAKDGYNELAITVNNLPVLIMGGNWGLDEALKRIPRQRLFNQVRMHRDANLNLIRNWNGQSTGRDFFEACDEYGILVWQEFFFSTEGNGASAPYNVPRYLDNIRDVITTYRSHPSILLWCGGNEGTPNNQKLVDGLDKLVAELDPKRECLTSSAGDTDEPFSGASLGGFGSGGPYHWVSPRSHFDKVASDSYIPFHNEVGSYSISTLEFVQSMLPEKSWQCPDDYWADRDINGNGGNMYDGGIVGATAARYGTVVNLADFVRKSQLMNYECIKAIYESHAANFGPITTATPSTSTGVIMWMTNPAQPSFVWQMYSHDLEQHSSFFAVKNGARRINVVMDASTRNISVVNHSSVRISGSIDIGVYNLDGTLAVRTVQRVAAVAPASSAKIIDISPKISTATSDVCFVSLRFSDMAGKLLAENFYWYQTSNSDLDYTSMDKMPPASVNISAKKLPDKDGSTRISVAVNNSSAVIALMVHLQLFDNTTKKRILPAFFSNNYLNLVPGSSSEITIEVPVQEGVSNDFAIRVDGWNLSPMSALGGNGNVPVVRNENALAVGAGGAMFGSCG